MLRSSRFADILATLIMSCLAIVGWMNLHQEYKTQSKTMASIESKFSSLVAAKLTEAPISQDFKARFLP
jgi:hypothetical protein